MLEHQIVQSTKQNDYVFKISILLQNELGKLRTEFYVSYKIPENHRNEYSKKLYYTYYLSRA